DAIAAAVRDSDLQHIVFLSSIGAHLPQGTGPILALRHGEEALQAVMDALTILRAPFFMENWLPVLPVAKAHGVLPSFISPDRQIPMIATTDIGHLAAECLMDQATGVRVLELVGPKPYSPRDVAAAASKQFARTVTVQHLPLEQVVPQLTSFGISRHMATLFADMYAAIETGRLVH